MENRNNGLLRRDFLKAGTAGLAGLAGPSWWTDALRGAELPDRVPPEDAIIIKSDQLELVLDGEDGLPYEYRLHALNTKMRGEDFGGKLSVTICRKQPHGFMTVTPRASIIRSAPDRADFRFQAAYGDAPAAAFNVRYAVKGPTI